MPKFEDPEKIELFITELKYWGFHVPQLPAHKYTQSQQTLRLNILSIIVILLLQFVWYSNLTDDFLDYNWTLYVSLYYNI